MDNQLLTGLANNGPWALAAAYLLKKVLDAWAGDRAQLVTLMTEFKATLDTLGLAVRDLASETRKNSAVLEKITREVPE